MAEEAQSNLTAELLRVLVQLSARTAVPEATVRQIVSAGPKQIRAYNLCDGTMTQAQVAKNVGLDQGNFSRTVNRWIQSGVLFKLGAGREPKLLHLYPVTKAKAQSPS